jgi:hypothetical protein
MKAPASCLTASILGDKGPVPIGQNSVRVPHILNLGVTRKTLTTYNVLNSDHPAHTSLP